MPTACLVRFRVNIKRDVPPTLVELALSGIDLSQGTDFGFGNVEVEQLTVHPETRSGVTAARQ
jgi:hypothetical protein